MFMEEKQAYGAECSWKKSKQVEWDVHGRKASIWSGKSIEEKQAYGMGCSWMERRHMDRKGHRKGIRMGMEMCMGDERK